MDTWNPVIINMYGYGLSIPEVLREMEFSNLKIITLNSIKKNIIEKTLLHFEIFISLIFFKNYPI